MDNERIFGNPATFAIRYKDGNERQHDRLIAACCHLILGNKLIGNPEEPSILNTWILYFTERVAAIRKNADNLFPDSFRDLSDKEIFEVITKANQLEEEFDEAYRYLPQLPHEIWRRHRMSIDETMDNYVIYFYVRDGKLTFLLSEREPYTETGAADIFSVKTVDLGEFLAVTDNAVAFLVAEHPQLKECVTT